VDFYDIFAGTGIVGIEAISRGARKAIFLERDRDMIQLIRKNLSLARLEDSGVVRAGDAFLWAKHFVPESPKTIVFLGPPYPICEGRQADRIVELVQQVIEKLRDGDYLILQIPKTFDPRKLPEPDHWIRMREYGKTRIGIWRRNGADGDPIWIYREESEVETPAEADSDGESE
jgi:16S rRNA (guanine(966)-N(2))-methyltransferase RsmD